MKEKGLALDQNTIPTQWTFMSKKHNIEIPSVTWLATSGKVNFKYQLLSSLKPLSQKAKIIAYPDKGGYDKWNSIANKSEVTFK